MTDQIYHQVQYPLKKAISLLKKVDFDGNNVPAANLTPEELEELTDFLKNWEAERVQITGFVSQLRQISRSII